MIRIVETKGFYDDVKKGPHGHKNIEGGDEYEVWVASNKVGFVKGLDSAAWAFALAEKHGRTEKGWRNFVDNIYGDRCYVPDECFKGNEDDTYFEVYKWLDSPEKWKKGVANER